MRDFVVESPLQDNTKKHEYFLDWLNDAEQSTTWRAITVDEGLTARTYHEIKRFSSRVVPAVCRRCGLRMDRAADRFRTGCGSVMCLKYKPNNKRMRDCEYAVENNKKQCATIKGDHLEQQVVEALKLHPDVVANTTIGYMNGSFDVVCQRTASGCFGIQVKLAHCKGNTRYTFPGFKSNYPEKLPFIIFAADSGKLLVATYSDLCKLRSGQGDTYYFNTEKDVFKPHIFQNITGAVQELLRLCFMSSMLTRQLLMDDLTVENALEAFSFSKICQVLQSFNENLWRNSTNSNSVDAYFRTTGRVQIKATSTKYKCHDKVLRINLKHHAGRSQGVIYNQSYQQSDFDWLIVVGVEPYEKISRKFVLTHIWYIPMQRLVEVGAVRCDGMSHAGKQTLQVGTIGHSCIPQSARKKVLYPYFEDCCDKPQAMIEVLRSGLYGENLQNDVVSDQQYLDMLLGACTD